MSDDLKTVVILGMHRSGSSVVASLCAGLGVNMGGRLLSGLEDNPFGHFEDSDFVTLNEKILHSLNKTWDLPPSKEEVLSAKPIFENEIKLLMSGKSGIWGWKAPRTSILLPLYNDFLTNPYFIICDRDDQEIAESIKKRNKIPLWAGKRISKIYKKRIHSFESNGILKKVLKINFSDVKENPTDIVTKINSFLELENSTDLIKQVSEKVRDRKSLNQKKEQIQSKKKSKKGLWRSIRRFFKKLPVTTGWKYRSL
jgi:hypothetical protein